MFVKLSVANPFLHRNESTKKVNTNITETEPNYTDIEDILGKVNSLLTKLDSERKDLKKTPENLPAGTQSPSLLSGSPAVCSSMFGSPIDFSTKNILWTPVESVGIKLPCPLDTCCSVSLVSQEHAKNILKIYPPNVYELLANPIAVNVANPAACLKATGSIQVPIKWENGIETCFKMLITPSLAWPILFGENHLKQTKSIIDHDKLSVYFVHADMKFTVSCRTENPTMAFSGLKSHEIGPKIPSTTNTHKATSNITCLLTGSPSPSHMQSVQHYKER